MLPPLLLSLLLFRKKLSHIFKGKVSGTLKPGQTIDDIKGERATVVSTIEPGKIDGKIEFHGTKWNATSDEVIENGSVVEILERIDLTLKVRKVV